MSDKEIKVMVIRRKIEEHSKNFKKELEDTKKNQSKLKNTITKMNKYIY